MSRQKPRKPHELTKCHRRFKPGWWCSGKWMHLGPCSLRPKWWNVSRFAMRYRGSVLDWWRG